MENQDGEFLLDTQEAQVIDIDNYDLDYEPDFNDDSRYILLPKWDSSDGFRLMEKFAQELKNPVIRHELSAALNTKRGVFRSFKNVLEQYPETEKMWYKYKDQKMRDEVIAWYNGLREEWGLEPVGSEPEDISSIVLEDFIFREGNFEDTQNIADLHKICLNELKEKAGIVEAYANETRGLFESFETTCLIAETAGGEFCGCICAEHQDTYVKIFRLEVKPEYRGMGIGKTLLAKLLEKSGGQAVTIDLPAGYEYFSRTLHMENFKPIVQRYARS
jgi:GNAT superfamily N-acetyltransferase